MAGGLSRLHWSGPAERDIRDIWSYYVAEASTEIADKVFEQIRIAAQRLIQHPLSGRPRDELRPGLRSILSDPYVIFYRVSDRGVQIVRVIHGRRNLSAALTKRD
jgi:toxin ParE1/3/4